MEVFFFFVLVLAFVVINMAIVAMKQNDKEKGEEQPLIASRRTPAPKEPPRIPSAEEAVAKAMASKQPAVERKPMAVRKKKVLGKDGVVVMTAQDLGVHFPEGEVDYEAFDAPAFQRRGMGGSSVVALPDGEPPMDEMGELVGQADEFSPVPAEFEAQQEDPEAARYETI